jgi:hypothetical protein
MPQLCREVFRQFRVLQLAEDQAGIAHYIPAFIRELLAHDFNSGRTRKSQQTHQGYAGLGILFVFQTSEQLTHCGRSQRSQQHRRGPGQSGVVTPRQEEVDKSADM